MAQGFMESETEFDELEGGLVDLLRLLVRIKRRVQHRHDISVASNDVSISSATLQDLQEIAEKPSKRIKNTTADIKELETHAVSRQDEIRASFASKESAASEQQCLYFKRNVAKSPRNCRKAKQAHQVHHCG
ncbi:hypothetical protein V8C40DRAFT_229269 [Trichoderma camerunense]